MPNLDEPRQRRTDYNDNPLQYLKNVCNWFEGSVEAFRPDQRLTSLGLDLEAQKSLFIWIASRGMSTDNLDNTDPDKAHPAVIQDPSLRLEANRCSQQMLADVVRRSWSFIRLDSSTKDKYSYTGAKDIWTTNPSCFA